MEKSKEPSQSTTEVDFLLEGARESCSYKGNRKLWKAFVIFSKREYGSVCHILEPILLAILQSKVDFGNTLKEQKSPVVIENLRITRVVQRHRRVYHEYEPEENFYNPRSLEWEYVPDATVNGNGHATGCVCKVCRLR
jgi:hypothetical protein